MKWNCELIQDLLPLYEEGLCSPTSRTAVEEHLAECESCRRLTRPLPIPEPEALDADRAVAKSMKKVKRKWQTSLIAALLLIPILLLSVNQFRSRGVCWTNADEIFTAWRFVHALEAENWEQAAKMHDYSDDYKSIIEALSLSVESWGPTFTPVTLSGETWMLSSYLDCNAMDKNAAYAIFGFLYNRTGTAMVPATLWEQVIAVDPGAVERDGYQYWLNGEYYAQVTTPWGEFVISDGLRCATAADYCTKLNLVPESVWLEAKDDLESEAQYVYDQTHAHYDYVQGLSEEQFLAYMQDRYAADLESMAQAGYTIDCTGYHSAYHYPENRGWDIVLSVTVSYQGQSVDATLDISVAGGTVRVNSVAHRQESEWMSDFSELLHPSAHPDY